MTAIPYDIEETLNLKDTFGLGCPACGQADELCIMITTLARVTADGSEPEGDHEWEDTSYCDCPECGHAGVVADFDQSISEAERKAVANLEGGDA